MKNKLLQSKKTIALKGLSRSQLQTVKGAVADAPTQCIVYSIQTLADGKTKRYVSGTTTNATDAQKWASQHAQQTGGRFGFDCDDDGLQHQYWAS